MSQDTNIFGGKNPLGIYTPMSETEQEALSRLVETNNLVLEVAGFGEVKILNPVIGDHRLGIPFQITFHTAGNKIAKIPYLDLTLLTRSGVILMQERQAFTGEDGNPIMVMTGMTIGLQWDIGINRIDSEVIKLIMPQAVGLTTRRGNEKLSSAQQMALVQLRKSEDEARKSTKNLVDRSVAKADNTPNSELKKLVR